MSSATLPMGDEGKKKKRKTFNAQNPRNKGPAKPILNPRIFLLVACLWPLAILALFASSAPGADRQSPPGVSSEVEAAADKKNHFDRFEMRKLLDRVDVMGYGPTHPRVAFVVVGETQEQLTKSVKSIFLNTELSRIFVVVAVLDDGKGEDPTLVKKLRKIEKSSKYTTTSFLPRHLSSQF